MSYVDNTVQVFCLPCSGKGFGTNYWMTDTSLFFQRNFETVAELLDVKGFKPRYVPGLVSTACQIADGLIKRLGSAKKRFMWLENLAIYCGLSGPSSR